MSPRFAWIAFWISITFGCAAAITARLPVEERLAIVAGIALFVAAILALFSEEFRG